MHRTPSPSWVSKALLLALSLSGQAVDAATIPPGFSTPAVEIAAQPLKRFNDPMNAAKGLIINKWLGTGDSFSAGPGAGDPVVLPDDSRECQRNTGGYPYQLQNTDLFQGGHGAPDFTFASCTGDKIPQVREFQLPKIDRDTKLVTLSIGGNDIGFVPILSPCVYGIGGDCDGALQRGHDLLYGADVYTSWADLIRDYASNMAWITRPADQKKTAIYQTAYPPFFDSWTDACDNVAFIPFGPSITKALRERLNLLGQELNAALAAWIDQANWVFTEWLDKRTLEPKGDLIRFVNQDGRYSGHRFCREGVAEPDRANKDTWYFHAFAWRETGDGSDQDDGGELLVEDFASQQNIDPANCNTDPFLDDTPQDLGVLLNCGIAQSIADGNITNDDIDTTAAESISKTFHPLPEICRFPHRYQMRADGREGIAGFGQNTAELEDLLIYGLPGDDEGVLSGIDFRIMCVGDGLTVGLGEDLEAKSYRSTLRELLLGQRMGHQDVNTLEYVGSTTQGGDHIEGYLAEGGTIAALRDRFRDSRPVEGTQPNVVLLMPGNEDLERMEPTDYDALLALRAPLEDLVNLIFEQCTNCMVILSHVPPRTSEFTWPPSPELRQVVQWNAIVSEVVNKLRTAYGHKVLHMHPSVATADITDVNGKPTNHGYQKIAYDFAERLFSAQRQGWIEAPAGGVDVISEPPPGPDWESDACKACSANLGASECAADDDQCLIDQCKADGDCATCGANCDTDFTRGESTPVTEPAIVCDPDCHDVVIPPE